MAEAFYRTGYASGIESQNLVYPRRWKIADAAEDSLILRGLIETVCIVDIGVAITGVLAKVLTIAEVGGEGAYQIERRAWRREQPRRPLA